MPGAICGWCGVYANMQRISDARTTRVDKVTDRIHITIAYACDHCHLMTLASWTGKDPKASPIEPWLERVSEEFQWLPPRTVTKEFSHVPATIASFASEAHRAFSVDLHRACVGMARAAIQATAKERGITDRNLYSGIQRLREKGYLRHTLEEAAHGIRTAGNEVLHADLVDLPITRKEAEIVLNLMDLVLEEVYQVAGRIAELNALRTARTGSPEESDDASAA